MPRSVVMVAGSTGTGSTTDITSTGIGTIDGAIIQILNATADDTNSDSVQYAFVLYDGTDLVCTSIGLNDGISGEKAQRRLSTGNIYCISGTATVAVGTVSKITNGLRISWSDAPDASYRYRAWLLYGGHTLKVGTVQMSGTAAGTVSYAGCPFAPQAGIFASVMPGSLNTTATDARISLGAFVYAGSLITQRAIAYSASNNASPTAILSRGYADRVAANPTSTTAEITAVASDGFTVKTLIVGYAAHLGFMLFGGLDAVSLFTANAPASTGITSLDSPGFEPELVMMVQSGLNAFGTDYTNEDIYLTHGFAASVTDQGSVSLFGDDNVITTNNGCRVSSKLLGGYTTGTLDVIVGALDSFHGLGLKVDYTTLDSNAASDAGFCLALRFTSSLSAFSPVFFGAGV